MSIRCSYHSHFQMGTEVKSLPSSLARRWCSQVRPGWSAVEPAFLSSAHAHTLLAAPWSRHHVLFCSLTCGPAPGQSFGFQHRPSWRLLQAWPRIVQCRREFPRSLVQTLHPADIPSSLPPLAKSHPLTGPWRPQLWPHPLRDCVGRATSWISPLWGEF